MIAFAHEQLADIGHPAPAPDADADAKDCQAVQPAAMKLANGAVATDLAVAPAQVLEVRDGMQTSQPAVLAARAAQRHPRRRAEHCAPTGPARPAGSPRSYPRLTGAEPADRAAHRRR